MVETSKQLKKGVLEIIILKVISSEETYGYQIIKALEKYSFLNIKEGSLYPILYRLEDDDLIISNWITGGDSGKPKKYYSISKKGSARLEELTQEWLQFSKEVTQFLGR